MRRGFIRGDAVVGRLLGAVREYNLFPIVGFSLSMIAKQTGKNAESSTRYGFDMADPKDEIPMADWFHGPNLFELPKKDAGGNQS